MEKGKDFQDVVTLGWLKTENGSLSTDLPTKPRYKNTSQGCCGGELSSTEKEDALTK